MSFGYRRPLRLSGFGTNTSLYHYQAYGFSISSDVALPAPDSEGRSDSDLTISRVENFAAQGEAIGPFARAGKDWLSFAVPGLVRFHISRERGIRYVAADDADPASIATFLMNSALPTAAMLAGQIGLRGTAVTKGNTTLLLVGMPAKGKSSTAAALDLRGYSVHSDGVCVLNNEARLHAGLGLLTLPRDSAKQLELPESSLTPTRPGIDRFHFRQEIAPHPAPRTITHIYQLIVQTVDRIDFSDIRGAERLSMLRACAFRMNEFNRFGLQSTMLRAASTLSSGARFRRAWRPVKGCSPVEFADRILADAEAAQ